MSESPRNSSTSSSSLTSPVGETNALASVSVVRSNRYSVCMNFWDIQLLSTTSFIFFQLRIVLLLFLMNIASSSSSAFDSDNLEELGSTEPSLRISSILDVAKRGRGRGRGFGRSVLDIVLVETGGTQL